MHEQQLDAVFLALANSSRRQLLDLITAKPGCHLAQLLDEFSVSRIALMKHLQILLDAELVIADRQGRQRLLYFNAVPLQLIHERWSGQYQQFWASQLTRLKYAVESEASTQQPQDKTKEQV